MMMRRRCTYALLVLAGMSISLQAVPHVRVVIVIDQFAHHYLPQLQRWCTQGFATFLHRGLNYQSTYHPHGCPSTGPGHATIATGACADQHGIILNSWYDKQGHVVRFGANTDDVDTLLMVDTLSDQIVRNQQHRGTCNVYALSFKSRAAMAMAGKLGTAIWFDEQRCQFVSGSLQVPVWLDGQNKNITTKRLCTIDWPLRFASYHPAYNYRFVDQRAYASLPYPLAGSLHTLTAPDQLPAISEEDNGGSDTSEDKVLWTKTPDANKALIDMACACVRYHVEHNGQNDLTVWLSLSALDALGHDYGPQSREVIDMLYWLDVQLADLIRCVQGVVGKQHALFVLTADHGVMPVPELTAKRGYDRAKRINCKKLVKKMNRMLADRFGYDDLVLGFKTNQCFLHEAKLQQLGKAQARKIMHACAQFLRAVPGMAHVWTRAQIAAAHNECHGGVDWIGMHALQYYPGRTGHLICQPQPYCLLSTHDTGTGHRSPYDYDRHVPLIFYGGGVPRGIVQRQVCITQLAATLAQICNVQQPSACTAQPLAELFEHTGEQP